MPKRKIDWAAINFAFALFMVIISAVLVYGNLTGATSAKIAELERRVNALEENSRHK